MLSRRVLRVKVMQSMYSYGMGTSDKMDILVKQLTKSVEGYINLYLIQLFYIEQVADYIKIYADRQASKHLLTDEEKKVSFRINENSIVIFIRTDERLQQVFKRRKIKNYIDQQIVKKIFDEWIKREEYKEYIQLETVTLQDEKKILTILLKKILHDHDDYLHFLEEHFINLSDDSHMVNYQAQKALDNYKPGGKSNLFVRDEEIDEELDFSEELLKCNISHADGFDERIQPKLKNWDLDRVAILDMILIKMALCEIKYFPTIPIKVTINEYVDIAKNYSTPKSKDFVNGVIDKVMHEMKDAGEIKKTGRGLIDF